VIQRRGVWTAVLLALAGCNNPGQGTRTALAPTSKPGGPSSPSKPGDQPVVHTPPPVSFSLCDRGLPTSGMWKCDPVFADVNKDGHIDLTGIPRLGPGPKVWLGDGKGTWTESSIGLKNPLGSCGGSLAFGDINGDGDLDMAAGDHCQGVYVYLGDGEGNWQAVTEQLYPTDIAKSGTEYVGVDGLSMGDVNGDGYLDLLGGASDAGGLTLYLGDGSASRWARAETDLPRTGWANRVLLKDINADGALDIVASRGEGPRVWLGDGRGGWTASSKGLPTPLVEGLYWQISTGDVNEDGRMDLAFANWVDGPEVYFQEADGSWRKGPRVFPDLIGGGAGVNLGDIDLDGHLDVACVGRLNRDVGLVYGVFVLLGNGRGDWQHISSSTLPETGLAFTWGVALADVNEDNVLDVTVTSGSVQVATTGAAAAVEPTIPTKITVWCTRLVKADKSVLAVSLTP